MDKKPGNMIGGWAFLIGVILAMVIGLFPNVATQNIMLILVIIGIIVGLFNIGAKEVTPFLMSGLVLVLVGYVGADKLITTLPYVGGILTALMTIFIPATIIVALKNVFVMAK